MSGRGKSSKQTKTNSDTMAPVDVDDRFRKLEELLLDRFAALSDQVEKVQKVQGELQENLASIQKACMDAQERAKRAEKVSLEASKKTKELEQQVNDLTASVRLLKADLSHRSLETNIIISGVEESKAENLEEIALSIGQALDVKMESREIRHVSRLGKPSQGNSPDRPRLVKVQFFSAHSAMRFLRNRTRLRQSDKHKNVYVNEDLSFDDRQRRKKLLPVFRELRSRNVTCHLRRGDLVGVNGVILSDAEIASLLQSQ